jgi:hypothetical protein
VDFQLVTEVEGITWCKGCPRGDHKRGWVHPGHGTVHWSDRRFTRMGLRRFLMLVAGIRYHHNRGQPEWRVIYEQNVYAFHKALESYHRRLPKRWSSTDRARVRYLMGRDGNSLSDPANATIVRWTMEREPDAGH